MLSLTHEFYYRFVGWGFWYFPSYTAKKWLRNLAIDNVKSLNQFLDASTHLYKRVCKSVRRSVRLPFFLNRGNWQIWQIWQISLCNSILVPSFGSIFVRTNLFPLIRHEVCTPVSWIIDSNHRDSARQSCDNGRSGWSGSMVGWLHSEFKNMVTTLAAFKTMSYIGSLLNKV